MVNLKQHTLLLPSHSLIYLTLDIPEHYTPRNDPVHDLFTIMVFISLHWKNESSMETGALQNVFMAEFPFPVLGRWQMFKKCL